MAKIIAIWTPRTFLFALLVLCTLGMNGEGRADSLLRLSGCEFTVSFPEPPHIAKLKTEIGENLLEYQQASLITPDEYLRAECMPFPLDQAAAIQTLQNQAKADGLQNSSVEELSATVVKLRGYKNVQGTWATFVIQIYRGEQSALILLGAANSAKFPTDAISSFMSSMSESN